MKILKMEFLLMREVWFMMLTQLFKNLGLMQEMCVSFYWD